MPISEKSLRDASTMELSESNPQADALPPGWGSTRLDRIATVSGGIQKQPKRAPKQNSVRFLRVANVGRGTLDLTDVRLIEVFEGELERYRLQAGDLLVVEGNGSPSQIGRSAVWTGAIDPCVHQNHLIRVRPHEGVLPQYLDYYWNSPAMSERLQALASSTSGLHTLSTGKLKLLPVLLPPLAEQRRIVEAIEAAFSRLDAGVAYLDAAKRRLQRLRQIAIDREFDSAAGKSTTVGEVADVISGPAFQSALFEVQGSGPRLLRGENIEPGSLRWNETRRWPAGQVAGYEHLYVDESDLILAMDRPVVAAGLKLASVRPDDLPALLVQRVARIRPSATVMSAYLLLWLGTSSFRDHILSGQAGTQLPHITLKDIRSFPITVPSLVDQSVLVERAEIAEAGIQAAHSEVSRCFARAAALRRSVLGAAFSGRLVPQDPSDEPASVLLERIAKAGAESGMPTRTRRRRAVITGASE
jgi:type I restriction enzyme S subunit